MANRVDPDQTAPSEAVWSGPALFEQAIFLETLLFKILGNLPLTEQINYHWHDWISPACTSDT